MTTPRRARSATPTARRAGLRAAWVALTGLAALAVGAAGCARGPDADALRTEVQRKLDQGFQPGLFELTAIKRQGSAPLPASTAGASRLAVYYNATLKLKSGYDFGNWEGLSPASLAHVLGATEKGLFGLKTGENPSGETVRVYGSSMYEWAGDRWNSVAATASQVKAARQPGNAAPASPSKQLIDKLAALVEIPPPGLGPGEEQMISEELERALVTITARRERRRHVYTFASGPEDGEYYRIVGSALARAAKLGPQVKTRNLATEGSVANVRLIAAKQADYALVQSNVAAMAAGGEGPFAQDPAVSLRALGSLFPEPVHIVVPARSGIQTPEDLRGKRVAIGAPDSGTRADALAVLAAHGLAVKDLGEVRNDGLEAAAAQLQAGRLDAFFATVGAPTREIQRLATSQPIRLVSLSTRVVERLVTQHPGLLRLTVPAHTYPGQASDVLTVAATALLVTRSDVPDAEASVLLRLVYENPDYLAAGSAQGAKIAKRTALRGVTIPMHPAAGPYLGAPAAPGASR